MGEIVVRTRTRPKSNIAAGQVGSWRRPCRGRLSKVVSDAGCASSVAASLSCHPAQSSLPSSSTSAPPSSPSASSPTPAHAERVLADRSFITLLSRAHIALWRAPLITDLACPALGNQPHNQLEYRTQQLVHPSSLLLPPLLRLRVLWACT